MPNRFQIAQHKLAYDFIACRDGEYCLACFIENGIKRGPPAIKLQIDHADNNPRNWSPPNLHLLCQKHNLEMRNEFRTTMTLTINGRVYPVILDDAIPYTLTEHYYKIILFCINLF